VVTTLVCLFFTHEAAGALGTRLSLRPLFYWAKGFMQTSGTSCREIAEARLKSDIIASGEVGIEQLVPSCGRHRFRRRQTGWPNSREPSSLPAIDRIAGRGDPGWSAWAGCLGPGGYAGRDSGRAGRSRGTQPFIAAIGKCQHRGPVLSYELDRLSRAPRRPANVDLRSERAEAGRILLTASGHEGVSADDRTYLIQQVAAATGLAPADAEKRVDTVIANAKTALTRSRRSTIILAFSLAASLLLGAAAAWAGAVSGGRHRDGAPLPEWMTHSNRWERRRMMTP
jgi:hypothetical protein